MAPNCSCLMKTIHIAMQEAQTPSTQRNKKKITSSHIIIKLFKISGKKRILKGSIKKITSDAEEQR